MRKHIALAVASLALAASLEAQSPQADKDALKDSLINLEKKSWEAWKNHDGKFFEGFLADDHVEVGFGGPTTKAAVVTVIAGAKCDVKSYAVDHFVVTVFDADTALVTYHAAQNTTCGERVVPSPVWVSSLYKKRGERWLNVLYQQSQAPK